MVDATPRPLYPQEGDPIPILLSSTKVNNATGFITIYIRLCGTVLEGQSNCYVCQTSEGGGACTCMNSCWNVVCV